MQMKKIAGIAVGALALSAPVFALPGGKVFHAVNSEHVVQNGTANMAGNAGMGFQNATNTSMPVANMARQETWHGLLSARNMTREMAEERVRMIEDHLEAKAELGEVPGIKIAMKKHRGLALGLLVLENVSYEIPDGQVVRERAKELQQITENVTKVESRAEKRGFFKRLLFGGDEQAAKELEDHSRIMEEKIQKIEQAINSSDMPDSVKASLMERLNEMEQERAEIEKEARAQRFHGILGWLFRKK